MTFNTAGHLRRAEEIFGCDVELFVRTKRLSGAEKETRAILLYGF
jgi:hypothetical protein